MVNTDAIDGLIDLVVGESVIDAYANHFQNQRAALSQTHKCNITTLGQYNAVCSIGEGNDNYFVDCSGPDVKR